jgi:hypothetical protein
MTKRFMAIVAESEHEALRAMTMKKHDPRLGAS